MLFLRGPDTSDDIQIDHVVSLSDAWQKAANCYHRLTAMRWPMTRSISSPSRAMPTKPRGDGDAATWLPANKSYRCPYVARQIAVKLKYVPLGHHAEYDAMANILSQCPEQHLPLATP